MKFRKILAVAVSLAMVLTLLPLMGTTVMANTLITINVDANTPTVTLEPNHDYVFIGQGATQITRTTPLITSNAGSSGFNGSITIQNLNLHGGGRWNCLIRLHAGNNMTIDLSITDSTLRMMGASTNLDDTAVISVAYSVTGLTMNLLLDNATLIGGPAAGQTGHGIAIGAVSGQLMASGEVVDTVLNITLAGDNVVSTGAGNQGNGINVPAGSTLTITGIDNNHAANTLTSTGLVGIGANRGGSGGIGDIVINGGTINAEGLGGLGGPGIGYGGGPGTGNHWPHQPLGTAVLDYSFWSSAVGSITINDGIVNATGAVNSGAGIGAGMFFPSPAITINGGTVTATAPGNGGAAIGLGNAAGVHLSDGNDRSGIMGDITITGGTVNAIAAGNQAAVIGAGTAGTQNDNPAGHNSLENFTTGNILISGGTVNVTHTSGGGQSGNRSGIGGAINAGRTISANSVAVLPGAEVTFDLAAGAMPQIAWAQNIFWLNEDGAAINAATVNTAENFTIAVDDGVADVIGNFSAFGPFAALNSVEFSDVGEVSQAFHFFSNMTATGDVTFSADGFYDEIVDAEYFGDVDVDVVLERAANVFYDRQAPMNPIGIIEVPFDSNWAAVLAILEAEYANIELTYVPRAGVGADRPVTRAITWQEPNGWDGTDVDTHTVTGNIIDAAVVGIPSNVHLENPGAHTTVTISVRVLAQPNEYYDRTAPTLSGIAVAYDTSWADLLEYYLPETVPVTYVPVAGGDNRPITYNIDWTTFETSWAAIANDPGTHTVTGTIGSRVTATPDAPVYLREAGIFTVSVSVTVAEEETETFTRAPHAPLTEDVAWNADWLTVEALLPPTLTFTYTGDEGTVYQIEYTVDWGDGATWSAVPDTTITVTGTLTRTQDAVQGETFPPAETEITVAVNVGEGPAPEVTAIDTVGDIVVTLNRPAPGALVFVAFFNNGRMVGAFPATAGNFRDVDVDGVAPGAFTEVRVMLWGDLMQPFTTNNVFVD